MRALGTKKTPTGVPGHQDCSVCHPGIKGGRAKEKVAAEREIAQQIADAPVNACDAGTCDECARPPEGKGET